MVTESGNARLALFVLLLGACGDPGQSPVPTLDAAPVPAPSREPAPSTVSPVSPDLDALAWPPSMLGAWLVSATPYAGVCSSTPHPVMLSLQPRGEAVLVYVAQTGEGETDVATVWAMDAHGPWVESGRVGGWYQAGGLTLAPSATLGVHKGMLRLDRDFDGGSCTYMVVATRL